MLSGGQYFSGLQNYLGLPLLIALRGLLTWFNPCPSSSSRKVLLSLPLVVCGSFPRCMRFTVLLGLIYNSWVRDEAS